MMPTEMYEYYQIMICLLKLDFFVFVGVTMQVRPSLRMGKYQKV